MNVADAVAWLPPQTIGPYRWQFPIRGQSLPAVAGWISGLPIDQPAAAAVIAGDLSLMASALITAIDQGVTFGQSIAALPATLGDRYRSMDSLSPPPPMRDGWTAELLLEYFHRPGGDDYVSRVADYASHFGPPLPPIPAAVDLAKNFFLEVESSPKSPTRALIALARRAAASADRDTAVHRRVAGLRGGLAQRLAYGLSHEINNPLANIATRAATLARRAEGELAASAQRIVDQSHRAHAMIADLMFFAQPPTPTLAALSPADLIARVIGDLGDASADRDIELRVGSISAGMILGDDDLLSDAVASLVLNSLEAIGRRGVVQIDFASGGRLATFKVADSGPGVGPESAAMAADPYFCGREAGRGLGLGLTKAATVARLHGGSLKLHPALAGCVVELIVAVG